MDDLELIDFKFSVPRYDIIQSSLPFFSTRDSLTYYTYIHLHVYMYSCTTLPVGAKISKHNRLSGTIGISARNDEFCRVSSLDKVRSLMHDKV